MDSKAPKKLRPWLDYALIAAAVILFGFVCWIFSGNRAERRWEQRPISSILDLRQRIDELERKIQENDFACEAENRYTRQRMNELERREDLRAKAEAKERLAVIEARKPETKRVAPSSDALGLIYRPRLYRSCSGKGCW